MKWSDGKPFTADDFVFWFEDIYQNKDSCRRRSAVMAINGKPGAIEKVDTLHRAVQVPRAVLHAPRRAGRLDATSAATRGSGATRHGRLRARALPEAVPPEVRRPRPSSTRRSRTAKFDSWVRCSRSKNDWALNPDLPVADAVEDGHADQHADVDARAQPVQRLGGHRGQPAPVHRQGPADARPRTWRCINLRAIAGEYDYAGAAHRHRQAAGLPGEPAEGQLQGLPGSRRLRRRRRSSSST